MAAAEKPVVSKARDRMDKSVGALKEEFSSLRTGRASAGLLDQVMVEAYGSTVPLNTVAAVSVPEPRALMVSVWDRGVAVNVEKAIRAAGLGLNPQVDGQNLRIAVRNVRRDMIDDLKKAQKDGVITEDDLKRMSDEVQGFTDAAIKRVDEMLKTKEQEIMQV
jgi:ribosome recycling factor